MIYIDRRGYKIINSGVELDTTSPDSNYFECDEMIAPAIVAFNKKGYETLYSCSGHVAPMTPDRVLGFKNENGDDIICSPNELYVVFRKTNPNKNLLKLLQACHWDMLDDFTIEKVKDPRVLFIIRYEYKIAPTYDLYTNNTRQIAEVYAEMITINQKFYALARKLQHKKMLNKYMRGKRMPYFKNLAANTKARHERNGRTQSNQQAQNPSTNDNGGNKNV